MVGKYAYPAVRDRLLTYCKSICGNCSVVCCHYNISPVSCNLPLHTILNSEDISVVEKALEMDSEYKKVFKENVKTSINYLIDRGFAIDFFDYLEENDYSLKSVIIVYRGIDARIDQYNKSLKTGEFDKGFNDCFFLIPDSGCILQNYRPYVCKMAFRNCFKKLSLYDFVEGNIRETTSEDLLKYIKRDFSGYYLNYLPKIIIGANKEFKITSRKLMTPFMIDLNLKKVSYIDIAEIADFLTSPYRHRKNYSGFIGEQIIARHPEFKEGLDFSLIFIDKIVKGKINPSFGFGLEWIGIFKLVKD